MASPTIEGRSEDASKIAALESRKFRYEVSLAELEKPMAVLNESYRRQLGKLRDQYQAQGNLEGVFAAKSELESFESGQFRGIDQFSELARARGIYASERRRIHADSKAKIKILHGNHRKGLEKLRDDLTRAGKLDEALAVKAELENLAPPDDLPEEWWVIEVADSKFTDVNGSWNSRSAREAGRKVYALEGDGKLGKLDLVFADRRLKSDLRKIEEAWFQFRVSGEENADTNDSFGVLASGKPIGTARSAEKNELIKIALDPDAIDRKTGSMTLQIRAGGDAIILLPEWSDDPPLLLLRPGE